MKISARCFLIFISLFALSGCVSRDQADEKLAKGCQAGVEAILPEGYSIARVESKEFSPATEGTGYRHVTLKATQMDGWLETPQTYECVFEESFGIFHTSFTAAIYQIKTEDKIVGKSGGELIGDTEDFIKLNDAIRKAMYE
jgi:hypothetical protein